MSSNVLHVLLLATVVSSFAVVLVGVLRKPLRYAVGARAAYWQWVLVPASTLAILLPAPIQSSQTIGAILPGPVGTVFSGAMVSVTAYGESQNAIWIIAVWSLGAFAMFAGLVRRHRVFIRSLGDMTVDSDGLFRSNSIVAPMLIGAWRARIVIPTAFEAHYSPEERALVLAHERAHAARHDIATNIFATGCLCLGWFNPLMYWALGRLRFDQELACDAVVLGSSKTGRRRYATALLKTQLANESLWRQPVGCHWQSIHPLKERVTMLKHSLPGPIRRWGGVTFTLALTLAGSYVVWADQQEAALAGSPGRLIAVDMKWWVNGTDVLPGGSATSHDIRVVSGKEFVRKVSFAPGQSFETRCFASLSNEDRQSAVWNTAKAFRKGIDGLILLECKLSNDDKVFSTPAILVGDGKVGTIEVVNPEGTVRYKLEFNASTQAARTAAAR